jgi:hypothetical protein
MFMTCLWKQHRTKILLLLLSFAVVSSVSAEVPVLRLGSELYDINDHPLSEGADLREIVERLESILPVWVDDDRSCPELLVTPLGQERGRDHTRNTQVAIQSIRVNCWALFNVTSFDGIIPADDTDRMTPEIIWTIMRHAMRLQSESDANLKAFLGFAEGAIACRNAWRCRLVRPDEPEHTSDSPEQMVDYDLILATGNTRFVMVTQMIYGRAGFVYGVRMEAGRVAEVFPVLE